MVDSVAVFPPGFRLENPNGVPYSGATVSFFNAGTTTAKEVFADKDLQISLGTEVQTRSDGVLTADGTNPTAIYVGTEDYKIVITDPDGVEIETRDNEKGAVAAFDPADAAVTALFPVVTKSLDYNVLETDQNTTFAINCSAADVTLTLPSAVTVGSGWKIKVQHAGSANQAIIKVATGSGQLISEGSQSFGGAISLAFNGEDLAIASDGGNWRVSSHTASFVKFSHGIIRVTDRVGSAPSTPEAGALYLATGAGTWGGVSIATGDIVQWTGATWVKFTPYNGCGWTAYVQDEWRNYQHVIDTWVAQPLSNPASQADMEAQWAGAPVTANVQKYHPLHPKAYCTLVVGAGLTVNVGFSGATRNSTGNFTFSLSPVMSGPNYSILATVNGSNMPRVQVYANGASSLSVVILDTTGSPADPVSIHVLVLGDQ